MMAISYNSNILAIFRTVKLLYLTTTVVGFLIFFYNDSSKYESNLIPVSKIYTINECIFIIFYLAKICSSEIKKYQLSFILFVQRFIWIILSFWGFLNAMNEKINTDFMYYSAFIYLSNLFYLISLILFSGFYYNCINKCSNSGNSVNSVNSVNSGNSGNTGNSVKRNSYDIETFNVINDSSEIYLFANIINLNKIYGETECIICCQDYNETDKIKLLTCGHYYHQKCIDNWFIKNTTCPLCRNIVNNI